MWSVFLLMLFLALGLQPALSVPIQRSLAVEEEYLERGVTEEQRVITHAWLKSKGKQLFEKAGGFLLPIPEAGRFLNPALQVLLTLIPEADKIDGIRSEMNALNTRLDYVSEELKWAYNNYQTAIDNIQNAWSKYIKMEADADMLENIFFPFYTPLADSALVIHRLLTSDPVALTRSSSTQTLGDVLAKRFRCHEKEVEEHFSYLMRILRRGNLMDEKYYEFKKIKNKEFRKKLSKTIESESADAMFKTRLKCVSNSELYIKRDIIERIDDTKIHQLIANNIGNFLKTTYDRYLWMVVTFTTHNSKDLPRTFRRHVLSGFTGVSRGTVTVGIAHQIKGKKYTKAAMLKKTFETCLKGVACNDLAKKIQECAGASQIYTAIHVFKNHDQTYVSTETDEDESDEAFAGLDGNEASIYSGKCPISKTPPKLTKTNQRIDVKNAFHRSYFVLLKSDEELDQNYDPCRPSPCENSGRCERAPGTKIPMCHCPPTHFGRRCEKRFISCTQPAPDIYVFHNC